MNKKISPALFILCLIMCLSILACERHRYERDKEQKEVSLDLGPVKELLYTQTHIPIKSVLLFRDIDGWSALSTRCTYKGCDLTYQEPILLCPCCGSTFDFSGEPHQHSKASHPLPWMEVSYKSGHLYAHPGKPVKSSWRFTTPEIEESVRKLKIQVRDEGVSDTVEIPKTLMGERGLTREGPMFVEEQPEYAPVK